MPATTYYLQKSSGGDKVYLDLPPLSPPRPVFKRHGESRKMLNAWSGAEVTPGQVVHFDAPPHVSDGTLALQVEFATQATVDALEAVYMAAGTLYYSPDDGTTVWEVAWADW